MKKHGFIAIVGAPNVGKSTLTNTILGQKLSIVSPKIQTTRNSIKAIAIEGQTQLILIDTPGIFIPRQEKILERIIVKSAWQGLRDSNFVCFVLDSEVGINRENTRLIEDLKKEKIPFCIVINKIDLVKKVKLLEIIARTSEIAGDIDIIPISCKENDGIEKLKKILCEKCQDLGWVYDEEQITDAPMQFIACEITREKLFLKLNKELPYSLTVKNELYQVLENGDIKIHQIIYVLKDSQKQIILGKRGEMIKEIGSQARKEIAEIAGCKVHLYLFVKVKKDWMHNIEDYEAIDLNKLPNDNG